jgi:hypothetical protein
VYRRTLFPSPASLRPRRDQRGGRSHCQAQGERHDDHISLITVAEDAVGDRNRTDTLITPPRNDTPARRRRGPPRASPRVHETTSNAAAGRSL